MHSMTAAPAATSPPALSGWGILVVLGIALAVTRKKKTTADQPQKTALLRAVIRFYSGREMWGAPRSTATTFKPGKPLTPASTSDPDTAVMASIAAAPPKVSLVKKQPSPWARAAARWITTYNGRAAGALDRGVQALLWAARWTGKTWRALKAIYRVLAPIAATIARTARMWHCWPYALRALARIALTAVVVGLAVPAWRPYTVAALVGSAVVIVILAWYVQPKPPTDDELYGPRLWVILRQDLGLPEDEPRENWLRLPERLAAPGARIVLRLPWTFRGTEIERTQVTDLINSRLPGEWVGRYSFTGEHFSAVYTHKPPPKPKAPDPEPPAVVDIWDPRIQEALAALAPNEFLLGVDQDGELLIQKLDGEQAHWAFSVGSGGGKSAALQWLAVQMIMKRGTIVGIDPKMVSLTPLKGIPGVHLYADPDNPYDMRRSVLWVTEVMKARNYEKNAGIRTVFEPIYLFLEECNELADILKEEYTATKQSGDPAADPIWRDGVSKILRLGREVNVHIIAVFQDFKDTQFGGVSMVPLFRMKVMGNYDERQWKRIIGTAAEMPPNQAKAGRMVMVLDGRTVRFQVPYVQGIGQEITQQEAYDRLTAYYKELRERHGYTTEALYTEPPAPSPKGVPALLRGLSRDTVAEGSNRGSEGVMSHETAGQGVTHQDGVTGDVTAPRDRLRLINGQAGAGASEGSLDAPQPLTIAEIAREMRAAGYEIEAATIRQHKKRRESTGFPTGIVMGDGSERFFLAQLIAFYEKRGIQKRESQEEVQQDDAV